MITNWWYRYSLNFTLHDFKVKSISLRRSKTLVIVCLYNYIHFICTYSRWSFYCYESSCINWVILSLKIWTSWRGNVVNTFSTNICSRSVSILKTNTILNNWNLLCLICIECDSNSHILKCYGQKLSDSTNMVNMKPILNSEWATWVRTTCCWWIVHKCIIDTKGVGSNKRNLICWLNSEIKIIIRARTHLAWNCWEKFGNWWVGWISLNCRDISTTCINIFRFNN